MNSPDQIARRTLLRAAFSAAVFTAMSLNPVAAQCPPSSLQYQLDMPPLYASAGDKFGNAVAIDGNILVIGSFEDDPAGHSNGGSAHAFDITTGAYISTFVNPNPGPSEIFGVSVGVSGDLAVIGCQNDSSGGIAGEGRAFLNTVSDGFLVWELFNPSPNPSDRFGNAVDISGDRIIVGAFQEDSGGLGDSGAAYLFSAATGMVTHTLANPDPTATDQFGWAVAIDGTVAVVTALRDDLGATDSGTVYVFNAATGAYVRTIANPAPTTQDDFGFSIAVSGNQVVIGAYRDDYAGFFNPGIAYLFNTSTGAQVRSFLNPTPNNLDNYGYSVGISGNIILISARTEDVGATDAGIAYLYDTTPSGAPLATLTNPNPNTDDQFGYSAAMGGNYAAVGAPFDDPGGVNLQGKVYTYQCGTSTPLPTPTAAPSPSRTPTRTPTPTPSRTPTPTPTSGGTTCCPGDADGSGGTVNANDFLAVQANFGRVCD